MKGLVSVIIPIYNVEKYLKECLESVLRQTYGNIEIILVDDGSTDSSGYICDEYKTVDERIIVIHKDNGGLSDARNVGLDIANGEYLVFIDSDDYVSQFFIEIMVSSIKRNRTKISVLDHGVQFWDEDGRSVELAKTTGDYSEIVCDTKQALELMFYQSISTGAQYIVCHREIIGNIRFPVGYYYEDVATTYKFVGNTDRVVIVNSGLYAYRKREDSIVRQSYSEKKLICLTILEELENSELIKKYDLVDAAISRGFSLVFSVFLQVPKTDYKAKKELWDCIKKYRYSLISNKSKNIRMKAKYAAVISYLGMNISYWVGRKVGRKQTFK